MVHSLLYDRRIPYPAMDLSRFDSGSIEWLFHFCFEQGLPVAVANLLRISNRVSDWWDGYLGGHRRAVLNAAAHSSWVCGHIRLSEAAAFIANKKGGTVVRSQMRLLWEAGKASCEDSPKMMDCLRLVLSHDISSYIEILFLVFSEVQNPRETLLFLRNWEPKKMIQCFRTWVGSSVRSSMILRLWN
jgi:hypothetical protein